MTQYEGLAYCYDRLAEYDYGAWADYLIEMSSDRSTILDAACGTGSLTIELAKRGKKIIGLDISPFMLDVAAKKALKAGVKIEFIQQDIRKMKLHSPVELIISTCDSLNYILSPKDMTEVFNSVQNALLPG
ncbi:MAG TPA: class I SAM-dependent methyltransferase, partial [Clostridia bacterium]|nr:class I SAM-dependent methyltransferase [Clostridia bacterium]